MSSEGEIACTYCGNPAQLVGGDVIYPHRLDLADRKFWQCEPCGAWVGCHRGTEKPLGRLANADLRAAKSRAHAAFDPLWQAKIRRDQVSKKSARGAGYRWLAEQLGVPFADCHIGMFDEALCASVVEVCAPFNGPASASSRSR